jgi:hypothetical protein
MFRASLGCGGWGFSFFWHGSMALCSKRNQPHDILLFLGGGAKQGSAGLRRRGSVVEGVSAVTWHKVEGFSAVPWHKVEGFRVVTWRNVAPWHNVAPHVAAARRRCPLCTSSTASAPATRSTRWSRWTWERWARSWTGLRWSATASGRSIHVTRRSAAPRRAPTSTSRRESRRLLAPGRTDRQTAPTTAGAPCPALLLVGSHVNLSA